MVTIHVCHFERAAGESRNLRISLTFQVKSVRRSLDALRLLGMTALFVVLKLYNNLKSAFFDAQKRSGVTRSVMI